jgi:UDP-glucose 4-epimerase
MHALITGVAGFIGSTLAARLLAEGHYVLGVDSFTDYYARALKESNLTPLCQHPRFMFYECQVQSPSVAGLVKGVTHVFHLAGQPGVRGSWGTGFETYVHQNIMATLALLESCVGVPLERFVFASSSSVYGDLGGRDVARESDLLAPRSPYGVTKAAAEQLCQAYHVAHGIPCVALRYFTVYGPRQRPDMAFSRFIRAALTGQPITIYGDGEQTREFTYIEDVVTATVLAGDVGVPGRVYNIGGGEPVSITQMVALLEDLIGHSLVVRHEDRQAGDARDTAGSAHLAERELGFMPVVSLRSGLAAEYEWLKHSLEVGGPYGLFTRSGSTGAQDLAPSHDLL